MTSTTEELSATERVMVEIWRDILNSGEIGAHANFFNVGGDSIMLLEMLFRVRETLGVDVPPEALFAGSSLREVCRLVDAARAPDAVDEKAPKAAVPGP